MTVNTPSIRCRDSYFSNRILFVKSELLIISGFFLLLQIQCQHKSRPLQTETIEIKAFQKSELRELLRSNASQIVAYPVIGSFAEQYKFQADERARGLRFQTIKAQAADEISEADIEGNILQIIGSASSSGLLKEMMPYLPFDIISDKIIVGNDTIMGESLVLHLRWFPNPYHPSLPLQITTGNSDKAIIDKLESNLRENRSYSRAEDLVIFSEGKRVYFSSFDSEWKLDADRTHRIETLDKISGRAEFLKYEGDVALDIQAYLKLWSNIIAKSQEILGADCFEQEIELRLFPSAESKALRTQSMDYAHNYDGITYSIANASYQDEIPYHWLSNLMAQNEIELSPRWRNAVAAHISASDDRLELANRIDYKEASYTWERWQNPQEDDSEILHNLLSVAWIEYLKESQGYSYVLSLSKNDNSQELKSQFNSFLKRPVPSREISRSSTDQRLGPGFTLAHEGYNITNGYGSTAAQREIDKLVSMGSQVMSIVPYSYLRKPNYVDRIPVVTSSGAENDGSLISSIAYAQAQGLDVMLKPQIWISGSWPGAIQFDTQEQWDRFFSEYSHWILHFAALAELHDIEMFCIGTEFAKATIEHPEEWRKIIKAIRQVYSGPITYAANWGEEIEKLNFWSDLDYIGCNCYYPLSKKLNPSDKELMDGINSMMTTITKIAERYDRPILFTEIGYTNIEGPWREPHNDRIEGEIKESDQKRVYKLLSKALKENSLIHGVYLWKWPSYPKYTERKTRGFTPASQDAESVLQECFESWE